MTSADAVKRDFERRLSLNRAILEKRYWFLPVDDKGHEDYVPYFPDVEFDGLTGEPNYIEVVGVRRFR